MKVCKQCSKEKPITAFYAHAAMKDGHLNKCIECVKTRVGKWAKNNPEIVRKLGREKARRPYYRELSRQWRQNNPARVKAMRERWQAANPEKRRAHNIVNVALRDGKIEKPLYCQGCGRSCEVEAHHADYSKPLNIMWLCSGCHGETRVI